MGDVETRGMAATGLAVSAGSALAPRLFLRAFGFDRPPEPESPLGWRLFAVRTASISILALRGNETAVRLFLPVQLLDQATWWWSWRRGELPLRATASAAAASGVIIALDLRRRRR